LHPCAVYRPSAILRFAFQETAMKQLISSTCLVGLLALPVWAQNPDDGPFRTVPDATEIRASDFIGKRIYASEADVGNENTGVGTDWDDIGEVSDVILTRDGQVAAVLVDVGGFLGIGERTVAVEMDAIRLVSDADTAEDVNDYFIVMRASRANIEAAPEYRLGDQAMSPESMTSDADNQGGTEGQVDTAAGGTVVMEDFTRDGFVPAEPAALTADGLAGASVYDQTDERIGEISELLLDDRGNVQSVIVDVGGFLGVGERTVALDIRNLAFLRSENGEELRVYTGMTRGQLESLPAHDL
jgi:sporulation protein YlmC with PRC-barrel domain